MEYIIAFLEGCFECIIIGILVILVLLIINKIYTKLKE